MGLFRRIVKRRIDRIEQARLALISPHLHEDEHVLFNVPAEATSWPPSASADGVPILLYATDKRLVWTPYSGTGDYLPAKGAPSWAAAGVEYGAFRQLYAFEGGRGGFGFLLLSDEDLEKGATRLSGWISTVSEFTGWAGSTMGPGAGAVLAPALWADRSIRHVGIFGFHSYSILVETFVEMVNAQAPR